MRLLGVNILEGGFKPVIVQTVLSCALISMLTSILLLQIDDQFSERSLSTGVIAQGRGHLVAMPIRYTPCSTASEIREVESLYLFADTISF